MKVSRHHTVRKESAMVNNITVELPIQPKDIFRLLALRSITETNKLLDRLNDNFDEISKGIKMTARLTNKKSPFNYNHQPKDITKENHAEMTERELCASKSGFFNPDRKFNYIGNVLDYEMPLDDTKNSAFGKVDLVAQIGNELLLLEVKKCMSYEHPLRAMFEIFTFWKMLSDTDGGFDKFITSYTTSNAYKSRGEKLQLPKPEIVTPGLLLCNSSKNGSICKELLENRTECDKLYYKFLKEPIAMRIFVYDEDNLDIHEETGKLKEQLGILPPLNN